MKNRRSTWILIATMTILSVTMLMGCGLGTDVGNPTEVESASDSGESTASAFVGTYATPATEETDSHSTGDTESPAIATPTCSSDTTATRTIAAGDTSSTVTLANFFDYTGLSSTLSGTVSGGQLIIAETGTDITLGCTGTLSSTTLGFTCEVTESGTTTECSLTLTQQ